MAPILSFLADTLARWGAAMQRPLHPPAPLPPPFSTMVDDEVEEAWRAAAERLLDVVAEVHGQDRARAG